MEYIGEKLILITIFARNHVPSNYCVASPLGSQYQNNPICHDIHSHYSEII
jgi:hypothetical protein